MSRTREPAAVFGLLAALVAGVGPAAHAAEDGPPAPPAAFQPGDISIGEPIAVPFAKPVERPQQQSAASAGPASVLAPAATPPDSRSGQPAAAPPHGWLGMAVAESRVPGRWSVVEVAPLGPAAAAGIAVGDDLSTIDGVHLRNADEVAQTLTAITAGQNVRLAVVRGEQVADVTVVAVPRPTVPPPREAARDWQQAVTAPVAAAAPQPTAPVAVPPSVLARSSPLAPGESSAALPSAPTAAVPPPAGGPGSRGRIALGVRTVPIDPETRQRFRLRDDSGAYVIGVVGDLPASRAGIPPGSVIVKMNEQPVRSPEELTRLVVTGPVGRPVPVEFVLPGGAGRRADVVLQSLEEPLERALVGDAAPQPTAVPALEAGPSPRTSRRPVATEVGELRREISRLRGVLEALERRLEGISR